MALAETAGVYSWRGRLVAAAEAMTPFGFRVVSHVFGPISDEADDEAVGQLAWQALRYVPEQTPTGPEKGEPTYALKLGARRERDLFDTGRAVVLIRRDGLTSVLAQGTDGGGWSGERSMPRVEFQGPTENDALGAAIREMLAAFTYLGPEQPNHT